MEPVQAMHWSETGESLLVPGRQSSQTATSVASRIGIGDNDLELGEGEGGVDAKVTVLVQWITAVIVVFSAPHLS